MLPPWWLLAILVVVLGAAGVAAIRAGADPDIALPLCALGVLVLPYLPWLPDRLPVLRAAAGPARYLVWPVVFWLIACRDVSDCGAVCGLLLRRSSSSSRARSRLAPSRGA